MTAADAKKKLLVLASPEGARAAARFFKTGPGQYGEGDIFIGVKVPALRKIARAFRGLPLEEAESLLRSPIHEERLLALLILVQVAAEADDALKKTIYDLYLTNTKHVNNWDLWARSTCNLPSRMRYISSPALTRGMGMGTGLPLVMRAIRAKKDATGRTRLFYPAELLLAAKPFHS